MPFRFFRSNRPFSVDARPVNLLQFTAAPGGPTYPRRLLVFPQPDGGGGIALTYPDLTAGRRIRGRLARGVFIQYITLGSGGERGGSEFDSLLAPEGPNFTQGLAIADSGPLHGIVGSIDLNPARLGAALHRDLVTFTSRQVGALAANLVLNLRDVTPVDSGWARANWYARFGTRDFTEATKPILTADAFGEVVDPVQLSQAQQRQQLSVETARRAYTLAQGQIYITNNVSYMGRLDGGSSTQAPAGFIGSIVRATVLEAQARVAGRTFNRNFLTGRHRDAAGFLQNAQAVSNRTRFIPSAAPTLRLFEGFPNVGIAGAISPFTRLFNRRR